MGDFAVLSLSDKYNKIYKIREILQIGVLRFAKFYNLVNLSTANSVLKYSLIFISLFFFLAPAHTQTNAVLDQNDTLLIRTLDALRDVSYPAPGKARVHDFYVDKAFSHSYVLTINGNLVHFSGRYNVLKKSIEARWGDQIRIIKLPKIQLAQVGNSTLLLLPRQQRMQVDNNSFIEVLERGKITLVRSYVMASKMELGGSLSMQADGKKVYYVDEKLYYTTDFQTFKPFKKRDFLRLTGTERGAVENFSKAENLRWNKTKDVQRIVQFYNTP